MGGKYEVSDADREKRYKKDNYKGNATLCGTFQRLIHAQIDLLRATSHFGGLNYDNCMACQFSFNSSSPLQSFGEFSATCRVRFWLWIDRERLRACVEDGSHQSYSTSSENPVNEKQSIYKKSKSSINFVVFLIL